MHDELVQHMTNNVSVVLSISTAYTTNSNGLTLFHKCIFYGYLT